MKITYGMSREGNAAAAVRNIKNPSAIIFSVVKESDLPKTAAEIEKHFPGVPSIGGVGPSYGYTETMTSGVSVIALSDKIVAAANVLEEADVKPIKYIRRLESDLDTVGMEEGRTACFDLCCAGMDMNALTTLNSLFAEKGVELAGGSSDSATIAANGKVYEKGCAYLLMRSQKGRIKAYKENLYRHRKENDERFLTTDAVPKEYRICELNGQPAAQVYCEKLGIAREQVGTQTFKNPFGHMLGNQTYIISLKEVDDKGDLISFRPVNKLDVLTILELGDYRKIVERTVEKVKDDLGGATAFLSVNCLFRYLLFHDQEHYWEEYLKTMSADFAHAGFIGVGEHFGRQFVNQTMCGLAFE